MLRAPPRSRCLWRTVPGSVSFMSYGGDGGAVAASRLSRRGGWQWLELPWKFLAWNFALFPPSASWTYDLHCTRATCLGRVFFWIGGRLPGYQWAAGVWPERWFCTQLRAVSEAHCCFICFIQPILLITASNKGSLRGTWWDSTRANAGSCTWGGTTPCTSTGLGWTCWRAALRRGTGSAGGWQVNHEPAACPGCQEGQWDPGVL